MKFHVPVTLLAVAVSVDAAAAVAAADEQRRWCSLSGEACDTVRRAADAFADAMAQAAGGAGLAARDVSGETAATAVAREQIDQLARAVAAAQSDPAAYYAGHTTAKRDPPKSGWCSLWPGQPCWKRDLETEARRDAGEDVVAKRDPQDSGWCSLWPGQPCWKRDVEAEAKRDSEAEAKRDSEAEAKRDSEAEAKRDAGEAVKRGRPKSGWCSKWPGQPCWKRDIEAEAREQHKRCTSPGGACWHARRAAEAVVNAIDSGNAKREAPKSGWCSKWPGQPCWKRAAEAEASCYAPDGACTKATRDLEKMYNVARSIVAAN